MGAWGIQNSQSFTDPSSQEKLTEQGIFLAVADDVTGFTPKRGDWEFGTVACAPGTPTAVWASLPTPQSCSPCPARPEKYIPLVQMNKTLVPL